MEDTANKAETAPEVALNNNGEQASAAPQKDVAYEAEVERLRKEAEQAKMRANQLSNELEAKKKAEEEARLKQLEEKEEYKALYEQTQEQLKSIAEEREQQQKQQEIESKMQEVTSQYSDAVLKVADTAGLTLTDTDEEAIASFKKKLDAIQEQVGEKAKVSPNNNNPVKFDSNDRSSLIEKAKHGDKAAIDQAIGTLGFVKSWNSQKQN